MAKNTKKIKVSIIILTLNNADRVRDSLSDIQKLQKGNLDIDCIIVDNSTGTNTESKFKNYKLNDMSYKYIKTDENLGFSGGNNVGIIYALKNNSDYVLLLNDDMILSPDLLVKLTSFLEKNKDIGVVSPKIYFAKGYEFHKDRYSEKEKGNVIWYAGGIIDWDNIYTSHRGVDEVDSGQFNEVTETDIACGACMLIRNDVFQKVGLLDNGLYLYWEDADFSRRAIDNGFGISYFPETFVWHKVSATAGGSGSNLNDYFLTRNRYYFALKYAKLRTKFAVFRDTLKLMLSGREWQKIGARDAILGRKGVGSWKK